MVAGGRKTLLQQALKLHKPFGDFVGIEFSGNTSFNSASTRHMCQLVSKMNGKRAFLVDTLALVRRFEAQGIPSNQAEAITAVITEVLNDSLENVAQSFVSKPEMQTSAMMQETALSKFKAEVQSSQEIHTLKTQMEAGKYDVIKYCIGTIVSVTAVGLGLLRVLL